MKQTIKVASIKPLAAPISATVKVPGSKSYSLRALLISTLCDEKFKISNLLESDDVFAMQGCIAALQAKRTEIEARESGLTARFMTALACISDGTQIISGKLSLQKRPIHDLVDALRELGAEIEYMDKDGYLPLKVSSSKLTGNKVTLSGNTSSQYLSALLLIAPTLASGLTIEVEGEQISKPYIDMTLDIMKHFDVKIENQNYQRYVVQPQKYQVKNYIVEADYSSAAYFHAINMLTGSNIKVENLNPNSKQGDKKFIDLISSGKLPTQINAVDFPDQAMTLAVLAAFRKEETTIEGVSSLRIKETERIVAVQNELAKMGIVTASTKDKLTILGGKPAAALIDTYSDHRIGMAFAVAGLKTPDITIMKPSVVNKTFPGFWDELAKITDVKLNERKFSNILLIGMRGSGKTTSGRLLAKRLGKQFVDMDQHLEQKHGQKVRDLVLKNGWEHFRKLEAEACLELSRQTGCVISSGGGIVLNQNNMKCFNTDSLSILLRADPKVLSRRIRNDKNRPELSTQPSLVGELDEVWEKRKSKYYKNADLIIDSTRAKPNQIVNEIIEKLGKPSIKCLVIGDPVEHSLSPEIHNLGYEKLGFDEFEYNTKRVAADELAAFIFQVRSKNIRGISLTMPHKELVMPLLDEIHTSAQEIGAVNTIVNQHGKLTGYNTDYLGALRPLQKLTELKNKKVAILGAGGTAKAFAYGLTKAGAVVTIYNRTGSKAKELADKFGCKYSGLDKQDGIKDADIICNTTSVGMDEDKSPIDPSIIKSNHIVFDVVYSPVDTTLLKAAGDKGAKTISGIEMLLEQAFAQFKLFTRREAPEEYVRDIILQKAKNER